MSKTRTAHPGLAHHWSQSFSRFDSITPGKSEYLKGRVYHPDHGRSYTICDYSNQTTQIEGCVFAFCQQEAWVHSPLHARGLPIDAISRSSAERATPALARGQAKQIGFFDALIHWASPIFLFPGLGKSLKLLRRSDTLGS